MIGQSAGKSFAYVLGVYLGDGCVTHSGNTLVFKLNTIDRDFAEATRTALLSLTDKRVSIYTHAVKRGRGNHSLYCGDRGICERLVEQTNAKLRLPAMTVWSREEKIAFIGGLMDSEGFVAENRNTTNRRYYMGFKSCDLWVPDFVRLLESVGIRTGKLSREKPLKERYKSPFRFHVKVQSWIDSGARFQIQRKQQRVEQWAGTPAYVLRKRRPRRLTSETNMPDSRITP